MCTVIVDHPDVPLEWHPLHRALMSESAVVRAMLAAAVDPTERFALRRPHA